MPNLIDQPTYETFKNAVLNGWCWNHPVQVVDICREFKVSSVIASAWLSRMEKDRQQELAQYEQNKD